MRAAIRASISVGLAIVVAGCGLAILVTGCGKPVPVGTFQGERTTPLRPGTDPAVADQYRRITLRIDAEGFGKLEDGGFPCDGPISRTGDRLEMEVLSVAGVAIEGQPAETPRRLDFRILADGALEYGGVRLDRRPG